jgi:hypothetical protein
MENEPTFVVECQARDFGNHVDLKRWVVRQYDAARGKGCTHFRTTNDLAAVGHVLIEGWTTKPQDEGPVRWGKAT